MALLKKREVEKKPIVKKFEDCPAGCGASLKDVEGNSCPRCGAAIK